MKEIADGNYREAIQDGITLVDFFAPWCMPCRRMEQHIEALADANPELNIYKYNVDNGVDIWSKVKNEFGIMSIPFVIIYREGEVVSTSIGFKSKEQLQNLLDNIR